MRKYEDFTQNLRNGLFICNFCNKEFSNKQNVLRHQRSSCKENPLVEEFKCKYCKKTFNRKNNLDRHLNICASKREYKLMKEICNLEKDNRERLNELKRERKHFKSKLEEKDEIIKERDEIIKEKGKEIITLRIKCESSKANGKVEVYDKVCANVLNKPTVNNTMNIHPKLVNLPITNIHPLTENYVKDQVSNGGYTFDQYLKGENGLVDFVYSITMCENDDGNIERNYVCTDPSRDSYHRLVDTKEWQKDKGGKFVDVILDTISDKADKYHMKLLDERKVTSGNRGTQKKLGYDPEYIYKVNTDMHSGIVQPKGKERKNLRQKIKKETSRKISV